MSAPCLPGFRSLFDTFCMVRDKTIAVFKRRREIPAIPIQLEIDFDDEILADDFVC